MRAYVLATLLAAANAVAAPFAVQVGEERIGLDAPPGYADTTATGSPRLLELGEALTSASNRILLFAVSDADLRRFTFGEELELRRYMAIVTPRALERERLTAAAFRQFIADAVADAPRAAAGDYVQHLDAQPVGATTALAELRKEPELICVLQGARTKEGGLFKKAEYMLTTTTMMLVRGKALTLSMFTRYEDPSDLDWIRAATVRWIDELKRLNAR
jgi:hypothetical protein